MRNLWLPTALTFQHRNKNSFLRITPYSRDRQPVGVAYFRTCVSYLAIKQCFSTVQGILDGYFTPPRSAELGWRSVPET